MCLKQILAEAQKELNEVTNGNDKHFEDKLNEIDHRLTMLIIDMTMGIEGGEHSLFELISMVFKAVNQAEMNINQIDVEIESGNKLIKIAEIDYTDMYEVIRKIRDQYLKLDNQTETDLPKALQDAFDKSDKFKDETKDLKEILDKMKKTLADYERNLLNAKDLTAQTIEKFAETSKYVDETMQTQKEIEKLLQEATDTKLPTHEYENVKKLSKSAFDKANSVFDDSLELLDEVSLLELNARLDAIKSHVENLENYSHTTENDLKKFAEENSEFLTQMDDTLDAADERQKKAVKQMQELQNILKEINEIQSLGNQAIVDKDEIISHAKSIYKTLEDFNMKVEQSREMARTAFEKIPEILSKLAAGVGIVEKLEEKVDKSEEIAKDAKEKCTNANSDMDEILKELEEVKLKIEAVADELDTVFDDMKTVNDDNEKMTEEHNQLKKFEGETETIIMDVKEKVERTKTRGLKVEENVTKALEDIQSLIDQIESTKNIDENRVNEFGENLAHFFNK